MGKKKPVYKDKPRFGMITQYEDLAKGRYSKGVVNMVKTLGETMNKMVKS